MSENRKTSDDDSPIIQHHRYLDGKRNHWGEYRPWAKYGAPVWISKEALDACNFEPYVIQERADDSSDPKGADS
jgi:hypothetical protein